MKRLTTKQQVDIVNRFTEQLDTCVSIAKDHNMTRQGVYKLLHRHGVDPSEYERLDCSCTVCNTAISRTRARVRKQLNHFCSVECYHAFLDAGRAGSPLIMDRNSSRIARGVVSKHFELSDGNIVHHEDRNQFNNDISNLRVFACQGDHIRHHRGFDVTPIFDGSKYVTTKRYLKSLSPSWSVS